MSLDFSNKSTGDLENLVRNYRDAGKTSSDIYLRALESKRTKGLGLQKTLELVLGAARARRFVSYREAADANGCAWAKVHYQVGDHLSTLCEYAHRKGMPLLSAIVVNVDGIETGEMKPGSRAGFIEAARALGFTVIDEEQFVRAEQQRVFSLYAPGEIA